MAKSTKSPARTLNTEDVEKGVAAFFWNFGSLITAITIAVLMVPQEQLPVDLWWIVPLAPVLNAVAYTTQRWLQDNRK